MNTGEMKDESRTREHASARMGLAAGAAIAALVVGLAGALILVFSGYGGDVVHFAPWLPLLMSVPTVTAFTLLVLLVVRLTSRPPARARARRMVLVLTGVSVVVYSAVGSWAAASDLRAVRFLDTWSVVLCAATAAVLTLIGLVAVCPARTRSAGAAVWHAPVVLVVAVVIGVSFVGGTAAVWKAPEPTSHPREEARGVDHTLGAPRYRIAVPRDTEIHQSGDGFTLVRGSAVDGYDGALGALTWSFDMADVVDTDEPTRIVAIDSLDKREPSVTVSRGELSAAFLTFGGRITWRGVVERTTPPTGSEPDIRLLSQDADFAVHVRDAATGSASATVILHDRQNDQIHQVDVPAGSRLIGVTARGSLVLRTTPGHFVLRNPIDGNSADIVPPARADGRPTNLVGVTGVVADHDDDGAGSPLVLAAVDALHVWDPTTRSVTRTLPSPCTFGAVTAVTAVTGAVVVRCEEGSRAELVGVPVEDH